MAACVDVVLQKQMVVMFANLNSSSQITRFKPAFKN